MQAIPKRFFEKEFDKWKQSGYAVIDFTRKHVDLSQMPKFYKDKYETIGRRIERNYFLNHLLYHELALSNQEGNDIVFEPYQINQMLKTDDIGIQV